MSDSAGSEDLENQIRTVKSSPGKDVEEQSTSKSESDSASERAGGSALSLDSQEKSEEENKSQTQGKTIKTKKDGETNGAEEAKSRKKEDRISANASKTERARAARASKAMKNDANSANDSDASGEDIAEEFEGWSLEDHHNEMLALQNEFERLSKRHYDDTCQRLDEQIRAVNSGNDSEFKKNLQEIDKQYKRSTQSLNARKEFDLKACEIAYEGEVYAIEMTYKENRVLMKEMLIEEIRRKRLRELEPPKVEMNYYPQFDTNEYNDGGTEDEEWDESRTVFGSQANYVPEPESQRKRKLVGGSSSSRSNQKRRALAEIVDFKKPPVVYMLSANEIEDDLHAALRI